MFDLLAVWNSYCLDNNHALDCIYTVPDTATVQYKYYKILPYEPHQKQYKTLEDAITDIEFDFEFSRYATLIVEKQDKIRREKQ